MIIDHIHEGAAVKPVMGAKQFFGRPCGFVLVGKAINRPVQGNPLLDTGRVVEFLFSLYKITDQVARQYFGMAKGQVCVR